MKKTNEIKKIEQRIRDIESKYKETPSPITLEWINQRNSDMSDLRTLKFKLGNLRAGKPALGEIEYDVKIVVGDGRVNGFSVNRPNY